MLGSHHRIAACIAALSSALIGAVGAAPEAAAAGGTFRSDCFQSAGIHSPPLTVESDITVTATAPTTVAVGETFAVPVTVAYPGPADWQQIGAFFDAYGATPEATFLGAPSGSSSISGTLSFTATAPEGDDIKIVFKSAATQSDFGGFVAYANCVPQEPAIIARVFVGTPNPPSGPTIDVGDASVVEGDLGTPRLLKVPVTLSTPSTTPVTVQYAVTDGTAAGGTPTAPDADYRSRPPRTLTFNPTSTGETATVKFVAIPVLPDVTLEGDETIAISLTGATGGYLVGDANGVGTILDDDTASGITIGVGDVATMEGNAGRRTLSVLLSLSEPAPEDLLVALVFGGDATCRELVGGSPSSGTDCTERSSTAPVRIKAGATSRRVSVALHPDGTVEIDERVLVSIAEVIPADALSSLTIGSTHAVGTMTIGDDD